MNNNNYNNNNNLITQSLMNSDNFLVIELLRIINNLPKELGWILWVLNLMQNCVILLFINILIKHFNIEALYWIRDTFYYYSLGFLKIFGYKSIQYDVYLDPIHYSYSEEKETENYKLHLKILQLMGADIYCNGSRSFETFFTRYGSRNILLKSLSKSEKELEKKKGLLSRIFNMNFTYPCILVCEDSPPSSKHIQGSPMMLPGKMSFIFYYKDDQMLKEISEKACYPAEMIVSSKNEVVSFLSVNFNNGKSNYRMVISNPLIPIKNYQRLSEIICKYTKIQNCLGYKNINAISIDGEPGLGKTSFMDYFSHNHRNDYQIVYLDMIKNYKTKFEDIYDTLNSLIDPNMSKVSPIGGFSGTIPSTDPSHPPGLVIMIDEIDKYVDMHMEYLNSKKKKKGKMEKNVSNNFNRKSENNVPNNLNNKSSGLNFLFKDLPEDKAINSFSDRNFTSDSVAGLNESNKENDSEYESDSSSDVEIKSNEEIKLNDNYVNSMFVFNPPGHLGNPPEGLGNLPGHLGNPPERLGNLPGHLGNPSGHHGNPPERLGNLPGHLGNPPGHLGNPPGHLGNPPGHLGNPPESLLSHMWNMKKTAALEIDDKCDICSKGVSYDNLIACNYCNKMTCSDKRCCFALPGKEICSECIFTRNQSQYGKIPFINSMDLTGQNIISPKIPERENDFIPKNVRYFKKEILYRLMDLINQKVNQPTYLIFCTNNFGTLWDDLSERHYNHLQALRNRFIQIHFKRLDKENLIEIIQDINGIFEKKLPEKFLNEEKMSNLIKEIDPNFGITIRELHHLLISCMYDLKDFINLLKERRT